MPHVSGYVNQEMKQCIQECFNCQTVCLETINYCLTKGGKHAEPAHIQLLANCADICQTSAKFLTSGSNLHPQTCGVCAVVCDQCAEDCEKFGNDAQMKACAEACRRCAESCRSMSRPAQAA